MAKILVVEDDPQLLKLLTDSLSFERHLVESTSNGNDAINRLLDCSYDLIVLDWNLPGAQGIEILRQYRERGGQAPILFLTGRVTTADKELGLDSGADDYLTKPFESKEFAARVRALLRRPKRLVAEYLTFGSLKLDPGTYKAWSNDRVVNLSPREFALLEFLVRHPQQVFSIETLLHRVWESDADISPESVRVLVKRLRTKLGEPSPIKTVFGAGYMLEA